MRPSVLLPMLSLACTTHVRFDDINVEADVDDVNVPGKDDSPDDTGVETVTTTPWTCLLYTSPSPRDLSTSRMPSSA